MWLIIGRANRLLGEAGRGGNGDNEGGGVVRGKKERDKVLEVSTTFLNEPK